MAATRTRELSKPARRLRLTALALLLLVALFWLGFALLSGAERYGGGFGGVIRNSPNALPWALLLVLVWAACRWPLWGGAAIALFGLYTLPAFNAYRSPGLLLMLTLPLLALSALLLASWWLERRAGRPKG